MGAIFINSFIKHLLLGISSQMQIPIRNLAYGFKGKITELTAAESLKTSKAFKNILLNSSEDCMGDTVGLRSYFLTCGLDDFSNLLVIAVCEQQDHSGTSLGILDKCKGERSSLIEQSCGGITVQNLRTLLSLFPHLNGKKKSYKP